MMNGRGFYAINISILFIDTMYKHKGFYFMAEYANKNTEDALVKSSDGSLTGAEVQIGHRLSLQTGYLLSKTVEASAQYTNISLDKDITGKGTENKYTLGLSKYIARHRLKVQTDLNYTVTGFKTNQLLYRIQVDLNF
jgi:phosphate-selective porin OprO/OprP